MMMSTEPAARRCDDFGLLPVRGEPREGGDREGELGHPRGEGPQMLLGKDRRRHEHRHLVARIDRLEGRPHGHLRLAVAHVAAQQPVHRPRGVHVLLDRFQGGQLVGRFLVGKRGVEFVLPLGLHAEADAGAGGANGLQFEHLGGHVGHGRLDPLLLLLPEAAAEPGQHRPALGAADVLLHQADLRGRHVELRLALKLQFEVFLDLPVLLHRLHAAVAGDAVAEVYDQVAFVEVQETVDRPAQPPADGRRTLHVGTAEKLAAAQQHDAVGHQPEAVLQGADGKMEAAVAGKLRAGKNLAQPADFGLGLTDEEDLLAAAGIVQFFADLVNVAAEAFDRLDRQPASRFQRARGNRRGGDRRKLHRPADHVGDAMKSLRPFEAFEVLPAFALQFSRLDQQEPASRREVIGKVRQAPLSRERGAGSEGIVLPSPALARASA